eukprot:2798548-Rhodomonas_salina.5
MCVFCTASRNITCHPVAIPWRFVGGTYLQPRDQHWDKHYPGTRVPGYPGIVVIRVTVTLSPHVSRCYGSIGNFYGSYVLANTLVQFPYAGVVPGQTQLYQKWDFVSS